RTLARLTEAAPAPAIARYSNGKGYRYKEKSLQQAIILKLVRMLSAFISARTLIENGLYLDAASLFRIMDEIGTDIQFLCGPIVFHQPLEKRHHECLTSAPVGQI
ncbi:MAG: hypothetical protein ABIH17_06160, partial [Pseudomonadota bacterium]